VPAVQTVVAGTRRAGRATVEAYGMATARWRALPDFLLIGAKRSGSTSLYRYLGEHPQVAPLFPSARRLPLMREDQKGVHYFDHPTDAHSLRWYRAHFQTGAARARRGRRVTGEASPYYLFHPLAAPRAAATVPGARILVLLREPVARTYSHWSEQHRNGVEPLDFEAALDAEASRTAGEEARLAADAHAVSFAHEHQSYVAQSEYADALERWVARFSRECILVLRSEDLYVTPQAAFDRVTDFLGIDRHRLRDARVWNAAPREPLTPATQTRLEAHFTPFRGRLASLVGPEITWP
jgi:hypothetical protein